MHIAPVKNEKDVIVLYLLTFRDITALKKPLDEDDPNRDTAMELINTTPFTFAYLPGRIGFPAHSLTLIVKAIFSFDENGVVKVADGKHFPTGDTPFADDEEGAGSAIYSFWFIGATGCEVYMEVALCFDVLAPPPADSRAGGGMEGLRGLDSR